MGVADWRKDADGIDAAATAGKVKPKSGNRWFPYRLLLRITHTLEVAQIASI
jgi:hypothetical protein